MILMLSQSNFANATGYEPHQVRPTPAYQIRGTRFSFESFVSYFEDSVSKGVDQNADAQADLCLCYIA